MVRIAHDGPYVRTMKRTLMKHSVLHQNCYKACALHAEYFKRTSNDLLHTYYFDCSTYAEAQSGDGTVFNELGGWSGLSEIK